MKGYLVQVLRMLCVTTSTIYANSIGDNATPYNWFQLTFGLSNGVYNQFTAF